MQDMYGITMDVTKEMADKWLVTNPRNRSIKTAKVEKIKRAINNGTFELTHQGIAIDANGKLIDGHHRLMAISATGKTTKLFVIFNALESSKIDQVVPRSSKDAMYMAGIIEKGSTEYNCLTYPLTSFIVKRRLGNMDYRMLSGDENHRVYIKFADGIDQIIRIASSSSAGRGRSSGVLYAMLTAYYGGVKVDMLEKWHRIITTGDFYCDGDDEMTRAGRSVLLAKTYIEAVQLMGNSSGMIADEYIKKMQSSIRHFSNKTPITKLYGQNVYPEIKISHKDVFDD